jgi:hypothetical protein
MGRRSGPKGSQYPQFPTGLAAVSPTAGNGIFGRRDEEAEFGRRDRKCHRRPKVRNDSRGNPHRNGLFSLGPEICGLVGLDGGDDLDRTGCSPPSRRTGLCVPSREQNFSMQRRTGKKPNFRCLEIDMETGADSKSPRSLRRPAVKMSPVPMGHKQSSTRWSQAQIPIPRRHFSRSTKGSLHDARAK